MAQQVIAIGTAVNDGTGDPLRTAFDKDNDNFAELYALQSETINAGAIDFVGAGSDENKITAAIAAAVVAGAVRVFVPAAFLPYDASLVTFADSVQMVREGGESSVYDIRAYGAAGDNTQDDTLSIQAAIDAVAAQSSGGVVKIPAGLYKTTAVLDLSFGVQVFGDGGTTSVLKPNACNCLGLDVGLYGTGFGNLLLQNFGIDGLNCTTHTAVINTGTLDETDQFYGLTLNKVMITNYNRAVALRSARNVIITGCWFQNIRMGIDLTGFNLVVRITENQIVQATGVGGGTNTGILLDRFDFTSGTGLLGPEGVQIINNQVFGFDQGIVVNACNLCNILACDIDTAIYGIEFTTAQNHFSIRDCYIGVGGTGALAGIIGHGLGSPYQCRANIEGNTVIGSATTTCVGIQINDSGNANQDNVRILGNLIIDMTSADILVTNGNSVTVEGNRCRSTTPATNIVIVTPTGPGQIIVDKNEVAVGITDPGSAGASGLVDIGINTINGVRVNERDTWKTPTFAAGDYTASGSMTWTVAAGDVTTMSYAIHNKRMSVNFVLAATTVGGTLNTTLKIKIPGSKTATKKAVNAVGLLFDNFVAVTGYATVDAGGTFINIDKIGGANFAASTDQTYVYGQITFEID